MAETFISLHDLLYAQIAIKASKTSGVLKQSIVDALVHLSPIKAKFTEDEASFLTTANDPTYDNATSGFPKDLMEVVRLYYKTNSTPREIGRVDMDALRYRLDEKSVAYPQAFSWFDRKLYLGPPPSAVMTLYMDYTKDAQRDASGALITVLSTTQTNDWFGPGLQALKHAVLEIFYKTPLFQDQGRAAFAELEKQKAIGMLTEERRQAVKPAGQASAFWSSNEGNETRYRWGWAGPIHN